MNIVNKIKLPLLTILWAWLIVYTQTVKADWDVNMRRGVTDVSEGVYDIHMIAFYICVVIGILVFGAMFYSIFKHRKSKGHKPATFHESITAEVLWTLVPFLILIGLAIPSAKMLIKMEDTSNADLTIKVTGHQWKWEYEYLESDVHFFSTLALESREASLPDPSIKPDDVDHYLLEVDNRLVIPVDTKVRFLITASDVIHSWWMPDFAIKKDAIPGFINQAWTKVNKEGVYRGVCAELCGRDHGYMPIVVEVVSKEAYAKWLAEQGGTAPDQASQQNVVQAIVEEVVPQAIASETDQQAVVVVEEQQPSGQEVAVVQAVPETEVAAVAALTMDELMQRGKSVYRSTCVACHQANGSGQGEFFPALQGNANVLGDADVVLSVVMNGQGTAMLPFKHLSDEDIAGVVTYIRNAWGNDTGTLVQPSDVAAKRESSSE